MWKLELGRGMSAKDVSYVLIDDEVHRAYERRSHSTMTRESSFVEDSHNVWVHVVRADDDGDS